MRRKRFIEELHELKEYCNHPEGDLVRSDADAMGVFTIYCPKCGITFSRYDYQEIQKQQKRNERRPIK